MVLVPKFIEITYNKIGETSIPTEEIETKEPEFQ